MHFELLISLSMMPLIAARPVPSAASVAGDAVKKLRIVTGNASLRALRGTRRDEPMKPTNLRGKNVANSRLPEKLDNIMERL
jgi:hypothetical protein